MRQTGRTIFFVMVIALVTFAGCKLDFFDVVKQEVEEYKAAQVGSPEITVLKGIDQVPEDGEVPIGPAISGDSKLVTFSIENLGGGSLQLTGSPRVVIGGADAAQFSINTLPASVIVGGGKSDFIIEFSPIGTGDRTATLTIANNISDDGEFTFSITGEGVGSAGPEIQVTTGSTVIDENQPYTHEFGKLLAGYNADDAFTIYNIGTPTSLLHLLDDPNAVVISGTDAGMFSVTVQPDKQWLLEGDSANDHSSFTLRYQPSTAGTHTATVTIANDDANGDEVLYSFDITGNCYQLDVLFLLDVSGSMGAVINEIKAGIGSTMSTIDALDGNAAFALATLNDFPIPPWGQGPERAYELVQALTSNQVAVQNAANAQYAAYGGDMKGSHLEALYQGTTGEGLPAFSIPASPVGWRTNALHIIVLMSDSPFHDPLIDAGYPGHTFDGTIAAMNTYEVEMIGLSLTYDLAFADMAVIAEGTGGLVFSTGSYVIGAVIDGISALMSQY